MLLWQAGEKWPILGGKEELIKSGLEDNRRVSFFDVDARAELRSVPFVDVPFPPRVGEQVELHAETEHGGGLYLVVGVRHVLEDRGSALNPAAAVVGMVVNVKPQHAIETEAVTAAADILEEIVSVPVLPFPLTAELPEPSEPEK